ncbi:GNAT family N-acetyltransferase [Dyella sp. A6]|uniref:GNAT family N-acetyltransferase n=1 Tax=Dyella aluminiiresistens TaxID=3069105 RepID=UPI002E7A7DFE|nr:GNAT family N-acetyltransferase [Dyella sp. A6]
MLIREITTGDGNAAFDRLWPVMQAVIAPGDTYNYPADLGYEEARAMWTAPPTRCFVAEDDHGSLLGFYKLRPNQPGRGDHVANASYMVAPAARGRGVARALCMHSLDQARQAGFTAMQFNFVVSTNAPAVHLWQSCGFRIVGQVPGAFRHATLGAVDVYVMHRFL